MATPYFNAMHRLLNGTLEVLKMADRSIVNDRGTLRRSSDGRDGLQVGEDHADRPRRACADQRSGYCHSGLACMLVVTALALTLQSGARNTRAQGRGTLWQEAFGMAAS